MHPIRTATFDDFDALARLWNDGWREAHLGHVPDGLAALRTLESFRDRLLGFGNTLRVAGPRGEPLGLCVIKETEIDQLFVSPDARGTGLAVRLLQDGEKRLSRAGVTRAHLFVVESNARARTFYRRQGWHDARISVENIDTSAGVFALEVVVMEKALHASKG